MGLDPAIIGRLHEFMYSDDDCCEMPSEEDLEAYFRQLELFQLDHENDRAHVFSVEDMHTMNELEQRRAAGLDSNEIWFNRVVECGILSAALDYSPRVKR
ncbi:hypothetical protein KIPB_001546 [Kipferlia bialata]|uniref:Uncharacterized protein n=1 Tax=Kipferlia bialata TaxID=797122 RepID=A0A9K3CQV8_9EUKA|nr:hypothetical protein KIPB_001546 [Kipferlia bialata]|eukprot:g1546.t1